MKNLPLHQEYLLRNGYSRPLFFYERSSVLYFKHGQASNTNWFKFVLSYVNEQNLFFYRCTLNRWRKLNKSIDHEQRTSSHYVDAIEQIIYKYLDFIKLDSKQLAPVQDLAAWESFLFLNDQIMSQKIPVAWHFLVEKSLSLDFPLSVRRETKDFILTRMQNFREFNHLYAAWLEHSKQDTFESSQWLVDLINAHNT